MNPFKKQIIEARKGKKRVESALWTNCKQEQEKLGDREYSMHWRVDAQEVVYVDKKNIIVGEMSEKVFDTIDSAKIH